MPAPPYADYRSQLALQIVSTNVPTAPAGFCCNQPLLATTFGETIRNSCEQSNSNLIFHRGPKMWEITTNWKKIGLKT